MDDFFQGIAFSIPSARFGALNIVHVIGHDRPGLLLDISSTVTRNPEDWEYMWNTIMNEEKESKRKNVLVINQNTSFILSTTICYSESYVI